MSIAFRINHKLYHLWSLALLTGMKNGELYALRWSDIDLVSDRISIRASWSNKNGYTTTKSNKSRILPISKESRSLLLELKNVGPFSSKLKSLQGDVKEFHDLVLPILSEWTHGEQSKLTKSFYNEIGITPVKFHDLRATFITNLLSQGVPLPQLISMVGHSRTSTTDEYLRLAGVNVKGATEKLSYRLPKEDISNIRHISSFN